MNYIGFVCVFFYFSCLSSIGYKKSAIITIEKIKINQRYYPRGYIKPQLWFRRFFKVKQHMIPKYLYFQLIMSIIFAALAPINSIVLFCTHNFHIAGMLVAFQICLIMVDEIYFTVMSAIFKRR